MGEFTRLVIVGMISLAGSALAVSTLPGFELEMVLSSLAWLLSFSPVAILAATIGVIIVLGVYWDQKSEAAVR